MGWIESLDMLGPAHAITFKGRETLQTKAGVFLTLLYLTCFLFACATFVLSYFDTSSPSISESEVNTPADIKINLADAAMLPIFFTWGSGRYFNSSEADTKYTFAAGLVDAHFTGDFGEGFTGNMTRFLAIPCKDLEQEGKFNYPAQAKNYEDIKSILHKYGMCIDISDPENVFINGTGYQDNDRFLWVRASTCYHRPDCETLSKYNEINVVMPHYKNTFGDKNAPAEIEINVFDYMRFIDYDLSHRKIIEVQRKSVYDTPRLFGEPKLVYSAGFIKNKISEVDSRGFPNPGVFTCESEGTFRSRYCRSLFVLEYKVLTTEMVYTRTYTTLVSLLSEIGGISSTILTFFVFAKRKRSTASSSSTRLWFFTSTMSVVVFRRATM